MKTSDRAPWPNRVWNPRRRTWEPVQGNTIPEGSIITERSDGWVLCVQSADVARAMGLPVHRRGTIMPLLDEYGGEVASRTLLTKDLVRS